MWRLPFSPSRRSSCYLQESWLLLLFSFGVTPGGTRVTPSSSREHKEPGIEHEWAMCTVSVLPTVFSGHHISPLLPGPLLSKLPPPCFSIWLWESWASSSHTGTATSPSLLRCLFTRLTDVRHWRCFMVNPRFPVQVPRIRFIFGTQQCRERKMTCASSLEQLPGPDSPPPGINPIIFASALG